MSAGDAPRAARTMEDAVNELRRMNVAQLNAERARLAEIVSDAQMRISLINGAMEIAREREAQLAKLAEHLRARTFFIGDFLGDRRFRLGCCASPPDARGSFWVGVGPDEQLLAAYEFVRQGRHGARRSGRTMGKPLDGLYATALELELDRLYAGAHL